MLCGSLVNAAIQSCKLPQRSPDPSWIKVSLLLMEGKWRVGEGGRREMAGQEKGKRGAGQGPPFMDPIYARFQTRTMGLK